MKPTEEVLEDLVKGSNISVNSDLELVRAVANAAAKDDEQRAEKAKEKGTKDEDNILRRKPELQPISERKQRPVPLTPWEVLHVLARATAVSKRGAGRGLAEHWGALKYNQALTGDLGSFMKLSEEGKETAGHYKTIQSGELGIGFGLVVAQRVLAQRHPDRVVTIVPADMALAAGWKKLGQYRPQFFAELWKPGDRSLVLPIACKGNHSNIRYSHDQLASASAHVERVHIGPWNETPALIFSTELPLDDYLTVHALHAPGRGGWLSKPSVEDGGLDVELADENFFPGIQRPAEDGKPPASDAGFHITLAQYEWFARVLARTGAAGLMAFAGVGKPTMQYLTRRQGKKRFEEFLHPASDSVEDAAHEFLGTRFNGTDHVFRLNGNRVEAFSGVANDLLDLLKKGQVEQYRREIYDRRSAGVSVSWAAEWDGPASIHPDGTVLAIRVLR